jgi:Phosphoesterase family
VTERFRRVAFAAALTVVPIVANGCGGGSTTAGRSRPSTTATTAVPATTGPRPSPMCGSATAGPPQYDHVLWVWMENHTASDVIGSADAPYTTALARQCGTVTHYESVGSPSLPNYVGATSGDTQGISDDAPPAGHPLSVDNLFRQVRASGRTERSYSESMTTNCQLESSGEYAVKHNPAPYFVANQDRAACQRDNVPLGTPDAGALRQDLEAGTLPAFAFITPNLCNDTHDCPVRTGDDWMRQWLPVVVASPEYRQGRTAVFLVWDEPTPMPFVAIAPSVPAGVVASTPASHYALLRTTEELLGLPLLEHAATAPSLRSAFRL